MSRKAENRHVLGHCVKVDAPHHCAFFEACAVEGPDGGFVPVTDGRQEFPTRGSFRVVPAELHIGMPDFGAVGCFEAEPDPNFDVSRGRSPSLFRAIALLPEAMRLIVSVPHSVKESTEIGAELRKGIRVRHAIGTKTAVMLQLSDGIIAGPFVLKQASGSPLYLADEQTLHQPKMAWSTVTKLPLIKLGSNSTIVTVCAGKLPEPDRFVDFGPAELSLRKILNELVEQGQLKADGLTKGKAQSLAITLAKLEPSEHIRARLEAVAGRINAAKEWDDIWNPFMETLLADPKIVALLEKEKAAARLDAAKELEGQQETARAAVTQAEQLRAQVDASIAAKKSELAGLQQQAIAAETQLADKIRTAMGQIMQESEKLIAQAAMLRPLLGGTAEPTLRTARAGSGFRVGVKKQPEAGELVDDREALRVLCHNLQAAGLSPAYVGELSATLLATFAAGMPVSIRGSMAAPFAQLLLLSLFARCHYEAEIPVGFSEILTWGDWGLAEPPLPGTGVLLSGANRSCLDAYAGGVLPVRQFFDGRRGPAFVITLLEGPAALPVGPQHSALGPIIHTDALPWNQPDGSTMRIGAWRMTAAVAAADAPAEDLEELRAAVAGFPNAAFETGTRGLLRTLNHWHALKENGRPGKGDGLGALATWYLAPYLASQSAPADALAKFPAAAAEKRVRDTLLRILFRPESP
jgi:hypothetical protein